MPGEDDYAEMRAIVHAAIDRIFDSASFVEVNDKQDYDSQPADDGPWMRHTLLPSGTYTIRWESKVPSAV